LLPCEEERVVDSPAVSVAAAGIEGAVSVPTSADLRNGRSDIPGTDLEPVEQVLSASAHQEDGDRSRGAAAGLLDLVFNDLNSPWAVEIMRGVQQAAHAAGYGTVVSAIHRSSTCTWQWLDNLRARASAGAILVTTALNSALRSELAHLHIPAVVIDPAGKSDLDLPTICATNRAGGLSATEHLISLGHRRIGHISGSPDIWCSRGRLRGYREALDAADLTFDPDLVVPGKFDYESGFQSGRRLLDLADSPTAVFAASDQMALGTVEAAHRVGLRVPEDLSVVGFNDLPEVRWSSPPLTTVRQPLIAMGTHAVAMLLALADGKVLQRSQVEFATALMVRGSTGRRS
jgi:LacI family transcriptional regulator